MDFLIGTIVILFCLIIGLIPFALLYYFADMLSFILFRVIKYRRAVIEKNLRDTFPDCTDDEIRDLIRKTYKNLADITLEGIKAFNMSSRQIMARHKVSNPQVVESFYSEGRSVIVCTGHCANWEWGSMSGGLQLPGFHIVVMYKPLNNKLLDRYLRWTRAHFASHLSSIYETARIFERFAPATSLFILAADQSPSNLGKALWVDFLGRKTAFLHGPEFYAKKHDLPVIYVDIQRVKRGFYELTFELITDSPNELPAGEITQRYANKLAETIRRQPGNWLWSHRRWKHVR